MLSQGMKIGPENGRDQRYFNSETSCSCRRSACRMPADWPGFGSARSRPLAIFTSSIFDTWLCSAVLDDGQQRAGGVDAGSACCQECPARHCNCAHRTVRGSNGYRPPNRQILSCPPGQLDSEPRVARPRSRSRMYDPVVEVPPDEIAAALAPAAMPIVNPLAVADLHAAATPR